MDAPTTACPQTFVLPGYVAFKDHKLPASWVMYRSCKIRPLGHFYCASCNFQVPNRPGLFEPHYKWVGMCRCPTPGLGVNRAQNIRTFHYAGQHGWGFSYLWDGGQPRPNATSGTLHLLSPRQFKVSHSPQTLPDTLSLVYYLKILQFREATHTIPSFTPPAYVSALGCRKPRTNSPTAVYV